jgi:hypothetical protein
MSVAVGSAAMESSSQQPTYESQHYPSLRRHPYQRLLSQQEPCPITPWASDAFSDLGVAQPNEDPLKYAAMMAARGARVAEWGGKSKFQRRS